MDTSDREAWLEARMNLLTQEKAHARAGDELAAARRALPKLKLDKSYTFGTTSGPKSLDDLFEGRSQLIVQHFMFGPDWEAGCPSCSFWADGYDPMIRHMNARDISFVVASRAPLQSIDSYRRRMGWSFQWVSTADSDFNFDFQVSATPQQTAEGVVRYNYQEAPLRSEEMHGTSVFERNSSGAVFHTYSTYGRGLDAMNAAYAYIDLTPRGRDESQLPFSMAWVKRHDEY